MSRSSQCVARTINRRRAETVCGTPIGRAMCSLKANPTASSWVHKDRTKALRFGWPASLTTSSYSPRANIKRMSSRAASPLHSSGLRPTDGHLPCMTCVRPSPSLGFSDKPTPSSSAYASSCSKKWRTLITTPSGAAIADAVPSEFLHQPHGKILESVGEWRSILRLPS